MSEHQEFLYELSIRHNAVRGKTVKNPVEVKLNKVAVEEKEKTFKFIGSNLIYRTFIKKSELIKVFDCLGDITIYCNKEEDIPKMFELSENFLQDIADRAMQIYNKKTNTLKCLKEFKEANNNVEI